MTYLKYYTEEHQEFPEAFNKKFSSPIDTEFVARKLVRHFKLRNVSINWTSGRNHANAGWMRITLNRDMNSYGLLCHELGHIYTLQYEDKLYKSGEKHKWHNKKHKKVMKRMILYCQKKNWFEEELARKNAPRPQKPEPTIQEIKAKELLRVQERIVRYEKKILFYQRKLAKAKRSYSIRRIYLEKTTSS